MLDSTVKWISGHIIGNDKQHEIIALPTSAIEILEIYDENVYPTIDALFCHKR